MPHKGSDPGPAAPTASPELLVELDRSQPRRLRRQLEDALRDAVRAGRLPAGTRVPASRALAADLGVTRGVVVAAYDQLVAEGYLSARTGAGTVVNEAARPAGPRGGEVRPAVDVDLRPGHPDLSLFPRAAWARATRAAMASMPDEQLGYVDARGLPGLRTAVVEYLARVRGVTGTPDHAMICNGFVHGFAVVAEVLRDRGLGVVATEDPGYADPRAVARRLGLDVVGVPVDDDGIDVERLRATGARVVVVTPAHQSPTGAVLSAQRRTDLVRWASDVDGYIIEDDYDAEFRYDRQPIGAVQGVAADRTIYISSLSKSLAPGLRLGWMVLPAELVSPATELRAAAEGSTSTLVQATFAELLVRGDLDRHLRRARRVYRERRDVFLAALRRELPDAHPGEVAAGLHVPVWLPGGTDEGAVVVAAAARRVAVAPMAQFRIADGAPGLVVGFARVRPSAAARAARLLAEAVDDARR